MSQFRPLVSFPEVMLHAHKNQSFLISGNIDVSVLDP